MPRARGRKNKSVFYPPLAPSRSLNIGRRLRLWILDFSWAPLKGKGGLGGSSLSANSGVHRGCVCTCMKARRRQSGRRWTEGVRQGSDIRSLNVWMKASALVCTTLLTTSCVRDNKETPTVSLLPHCWSSITIRSNSDLGRPERRNSEQVGGVDMVALNDSLRNLTLAVGYVERSKVEGELFQLRHELFDPSEEFLFTNIFMSKRKLMFILSDSSYEFMFLDSISQDPWFSSSNNHVNNKCLIACQ